MSTKTLKNGERVDIIPAIEASRQSLAIFYSLAYPARANFLINHWKWLYSGRNSQNIESWPIVAQTQSGTIIGHAATIPTHVIIDNELFEASWFVDYFVEETFRGQGLASILINEVMNSATILAIIGSSSTAKSVFRHHGWAEYFGTVSYSLPIKISNHPRFRLAPFRRLLPTADYFIKKYYQLKNRAGTDEFELLPLTQTMLKIFTDDLSDVRDCILQHHDEIFLTKRLIDFPFNKQIKVYRSKHSTALLRFTNSGGSNRINILKTKTTSPVLFFKQILALGLEHDIDEITLVSSDREAQDSFDRLFPVRKDIPYYLFSHTQRLPASTPVKPARWEMIDSDLDLVHTN